jgi:hypothetical protein
MRRLLGYLRPHKHWVAGALLALVGDSFLQLAQPTREARPSTGTSRRGDLAGMNRIALVYLAVLLGAFALEYGAGPI